MPQFMPENPPTGATYLPKEETGTSFPPDRTARGLIFKRDTYIPLDVVVRRSGTNVFINIPKLIVGTMPWDTPPSRTESRSKQGPRATDVDKLYGSRSPSSHEAS